MAPSPYPSVALRVSVRLLSAQLGCRDGERWRVVAAARRSLDGAEDTQVLIYASIHTFSIPSECQKAADRAR